MLRVHLTAVGEDFKRIPLGFIETDKPLTEAKQEAYDKLWDVRFDAASCRPQYDWEEFEDEDHTEG